MAQQGASTAPVQHWLQGAARLAQALGGRVVDRRADQEEENREDRYMKTLQKAMQSAQPSPIISAGGQQSSGPDYDALAKVLYTNPDTAQLGVQYSMEGMKQKGSKESKLAEMLAQRQMERTLPKPPAGATYVGGQLQYDPAYLDAQKQIKGAGKTAITNIVGGSNKFLEGVGKGASEQLMKERTSAMDAAKMLQSNNEALALLDEGMITGAFADWQVGLGRVLQKVGFTESEDPVANAQAYGAAAAQRVAGIIKAFGAGTGLSDADREYARKAAAGDIEMTEEAIRKVIDINNRAATNAIKNYNAQASKIPSGVVPYELTIEMPKTPEITPQSTPKAPTVEDLIRKYTQ